VNAHVADLAVELRHRGHEVRVFGVAEKSTPPGIVRIGRTTRIPINAGIARIAISPLLVGRMRVALRRMNPDVVHIHEPFVSTISLAALLTSRAPVVATFHSGATTNGYRRVRAIVQPLWDRLAVRIAVSNAARGLVEEAFGPGARIIPNGIDLAAFSRTPAPPKENRVLFFGRLEPRKGAQVLAAAWPDVVAAVPQARLTIAGDGGLRNQIEKELDGFEVDFSGTFDRSQLLDLLASHDIACLPAIGGESFGITLVEAMAANRPVVATAVPGYTSVIRSDEEGLLVPPSDPKALAKALIHLLEDPQASLEISEGGRARAERFAWPRVTDEIEAAYEDARRGR
jgi:phosphatidyl-myo-inositol alpha-mannosyltransferase